MLLICKTRSKILNMKLVSCVETCVEHNVIVSKIVPTCTNAIDVSEPLSELVMRDITKDPSTISACNSFEEAIHNALNANNS